MGKFYHFFHLLFHSWRVRRAQNDCLCIGSVVLCIYVFYHLYWFSGMRICVWVCGGYCLLGKFNIPTCTTHLLLCTNMYLFTYMRSSFVCGINRWTFHSLNGYNFYLSGKNGWKFAEKYTQDDPNVWETMTNGLNTKSTLPPWTIITFRRFPDLYTYMKWSAKTM